MTQDVAYAICSKIEAQSPNFNVYHLPDYYSADKQDIPPN
jgi:hypothetical protein